MTIFCKAMHKEANIVPTMHAGAVCCTACYALRSTRQAESDPLRARDRVFDEKHDMTEILKAEAERDAIREYVDNAAQRVMGVDWAKPGTEYTAEVTMTKAAEEAGRHMVMQGFRCIQPNKTRLPFWAQYGDWADLVCPHCSSSVSQGLTSGHHEMDGASPITLAMLRKEVPADDLRFAEPRPTQQTPNDVTEAYSQALREARGHVAALLDQFTSHDYIHGNPEKKDALARALMWLYEN